MQIEEITFEEILHFWKKLWTHIDDIKPITPVDYKGHINNRILKNEVKFIAVKTDKIIGVASVSKTNGLMGRVRGIWVDEKFRKKGIGTMLIKKAEYKYMYLWSMPRKDSIDFYIANGFEQTTEWFNKYEFGPHCFVIKRVNVLS